MQQRNKYLPVLLLTTLLGCGEPENHPTKGLEGIVYHLNDLPEEMHATLGYARLDPNTVKVFEKHRIFTADSGSTSLVLESQTFFLTDSQNNVLSFSTAAADSAMDRTALLNVGRASHVLHFDQTTNSCSGTYYVSNVDSTITKLPQNLTEFMAINGNPPVYIDFLRVDGQLLLKVNNTLLDLKTLKDIVRNPTVRFNATPTQNELNILRFDERRQRFDVIPQDRFDNLQQSIRSINSVRRL